MKDSNQRKYKNPPGGCSSSQWRQWGSQGWPWQGGPPAWTRWRGGRGTPAADGGWPPRLAGAMAGAGGGAGARRGPGWGSSGPAHGAADGPPDNTPAWKGGFTHWLHCATIDPTCSTNPQHETSTIQTEGCILDFGQPPPTMWPVQRWKTVRKLFTAWDVWEFWDGGACTYPSIFMSFLFLCNVGIGLGINLKDAASGQ